TRKLFADLVRTNGDFLAQVAADRAKATGLGAARCEAILAKMRGPKGQFKAEQGDLLAVLFVDALAPGPLSPSETQPAFLLATPARADALDAAATGPSVRRLLVRWVEAQPANSVVAKTQFADLARRKPIPEAVPVLAKLAK